ncbi:MAG: hypothetical protein M3044_06470 [Thermoproteota archaeon]|nr:hypothetical protein [Thermoproteota archaeon]
MPSLAYEDAQALKKAAGIIPKKTSTIQEEPPKRHYHLDEANKHKAAAEAALVAAEVANSKGDSEEERHYRMLRQSELEKEQRERDIATPKTHGIYKSPGEGTTTFIGMDDDDTRQNPWEVSMQRQLARERAEIDAQIRRAKETSHFNYKTGQCLNNAVWVGTPEDGHVESTLPRKIPAPEEVYDRLLAAEAKIAELESKSKNPTNPKEKKKPKSKKAKNEWEEL